MSKYSIEESTLKGIADATRNLIREKDLLTPNEIAERISENHLGVGLDIRFYEGDDEWTRPEEWPDLDSIIISNDFDGVYLTYDLSKTSGYSWIGIRTFASIRSTMSVDRGHIENGIFVVDEHNEITYASSNSGPIFRKDLNEFDGTVQLWRVTSDAPIKRFYFVSKTGISSTSVSAKLQPCVEAAGQLNNIISVFSDSLSSNPSYVSYSTIWLEKDSRAVKSQELTTLAGAWYQSYNLRVLDVSKWDTSLAKVTSLNNTFRDCYCLRTLDLTYWNTSNWVVTTMSNMCEGCRSLQSFDATTWDTSKWKVTSLSSLFYNCFSLKVLDLSSWDTNNWDVTTLASVWYGCRSLVHLKISTWNTTSWVVTAINSAFRDCRSLRRIEAEEWDTSNWKVTSFAYIFQDCHQLEAIDLSNWDTSKWQVTSLSSIFNACMRLEELDLSSWDTSNWAITSLENAFSSCFSLKILNVHNWDTSNWAVTNIRSAFGYCYSLKELDLSDWDTHNWNLVSNALGYTFVDEFSLRSLTGLENWSCLSTVTSSGNLPVNRYLRNCTGIPVVYSHSYADCIALSHESLVQILTALPVITDKTLTLGQTNYLKLTPEEIAIATDKGWNVVA